MNVTLARKEFHEALTIAARAVAAQTSLPVLKNVLLLAKGDTLTLTASDLELGIEVSIPARVETEGSLTVPAKLLQELIGSLPEADLTLEALQEQVQIRCRKSTYALPTLDAEDFPALPEVTCTHSFQLPQATLREMIRQVTFAVSDDDTRPILTGVKLTLEAGLITLAATDTHRLAVRSAPTQSATGGDLQAIVPGRALNEVLRLLAEDETPLTMELDERQIRFRTASTLLVSRLIEGQYPKYERVIPSGYTRRLLLQRDELMSALQRCRIVARDAAQKDRVILQADRTVLGDTLKISSEGETGKANEELEITSEGEALTMGFNVEYLLDALKAIRTNVIALEATESLSPAVLRPVDDSSYLTVVMPCQTN